MGLLNYHLTTIQGITSSNSNYSRLLFELHSLVPLYYGNGAWANSYKRFLKRYQKQKQLQIAPKNKKHFLSKTICNRKQSMLLDCCKRVFEGHKFCYLINWNFLFRIDIPNYLAIKLNACIRNWECGCSCFSKYFSFINISK